MEGTGITIALVLAAHEGLAVGGKEAGLGVDLLQEVLGADEGMVAAEVGDLVGDVPAVGRDMGGDLVGVVGEEA